MNRCDWYIFAGSEKKIVRDCLDCQQQDKGKIMLSLDMKYKMYRSHHYNDVHLGPV